MLMASSLKQVLQTYSELCIFSSAIQYIVSKKQPVGSAHEINLWKLSLMKLILYLICINSSNS